MPAGAWLSASAWAHSAATVGRYSRSDAVCGTRVTSRRASKAPRVRGSVPATAISPEQLSAPCSAHSSDDLPAPLRPSTVVMLPAVSSRSTPRTATISPNRTSTPRAVSTTSPAGGSGGGEATGERPWASAVRRASRTLSGTLGQPATSASPASGGRTEARARMPAGSPCWALPSPGSQIIESAACITRSSRCSASTTVSPTSCTSVEIAASTSWAAVGSRAEVGSSSTRTRGCAASTAAIATRCCWPPESSASGRRRRSAIPIRSRVSSTRLRIAIGSMPSCSMP